jgi:hypothetical protein
VYKWKVRELNLSFLKTQQACDKVINHKDKIIYNATNNPDPSHY